MKRFTYLLCLLLCIVSCGRTAGRSDVESDFRMHLRLWPEHHNDSILLDELAEALDGHRGLFDEVWFCMETSTISMQAHRNSAGNMGPAAEKLRGVGVEASVQGISVGHSDSFRLQSSDFSPTEWGTAEGIFGNKCNGIHCPRQEGFLKYLSDAYEVYARNCRPRTVWIDDDLRLTNHDPARSICYCEDCIATFNARHGSSWTRETLVEALDRGDSELRREWIAFTQESLAMVAAAIARGVVKGSPSSNVGLQHAGFHRELLEGRDWNMVFDSLESVTGKAPASRPGHGFYKDHAPREMIRKAHEIARQVSRLNDNISEIACEVEGYRHWATGKSPHGLCVESLYYLAMGATQLSYAIICSAQEPMQWYSDNYFEALSRWRDTYEEYADFNKGTFPGGVDPYISPDFVLRDCPDFKWITTGEAAEKAGSLAPLGVPYAPDSKGALACVIDAASAAGIPKTEFQTVLPERGIVLDHAAWEVICSRGLDGLFTKVSSAPELGDALCYEFGDGGRAVVVPEYTYKVSNAGRLALLRAMDYASGGRLPVLMESSAQAVVVPRVDAEGCLRSVMLLNCSISDQMHPVLLRLRGCRAEGRVRLVWHSPTERDRVLKARRDCDDILVEIPPVRGWWAGWLSVE